MRIARVTGRYGVILRHAAGASVWSDAVGKENADVELCKEGLTLTDEALLYFIAVSAIHSPHTC